MIAKQPEEYFFHRGCKKTLTNTVKASRSHFSLVSFIGLKYILVRQILHLSP